MLLWITIPHYPNICSKSVFCDSRTPPNAPALVARYGPFPNVCSQECSSGRTERSIPRGAPPPFQALRRLSDRSIDQALGRVRARGHSYGRVPLQATAKIHVPARAQVYTASATKRKRPTEQAAGR
ncbi:DNA-binding protein [Bifidobacterium adolescentis ATCC 15703]|uniref:DNA-binding protein n=1 Tax=Bifidobacterium adolescentis (strain ATCC 15703 / DSM 20083 / NCTC 11814 / E194a) TaxID=367928 RepID=A1A273_BIFAA|nr:DNA-binding protein [Bifidobacterium adolescentis ATCC 15703]